MFDIDTINYGKKIKNVGYSGEFKAFETNKKIDYNTIYLRFNPRIELTEVEDGEGIKYHICDEIQMTPSEYAEYLRSENDMLRQENMENNEILAELYEIIAVI